MVRKAKPSKRRVDCKCERETVRRMEVELEKKAGAGVIVKTKRKSFLMMVSVGFWCGTHL